MSRNTALGTMNDQAPIVYAITKEVVGVFDPRLKALVVALEDIHKRCLTVKQNRAQCLKLCDFCLHIVATIDKCVKDGLSLDDKTLHVEALHQLLIQTAQDVQTISNYNLAVSFLRHDSIKATITELRTKLTEGFTAFQITSLLALEKYSVEFAAAANQDRHLANAAFATQQRIEGTVTLMDHKLDVADNKLDNVDHKLANMDHKLDDIDGKLSDMKDTIDSAMTSQHAVRLMQIHGRMEPSGSAEQAAVFADLSDLQRQTGYPPLPLADLIDEAKKVGDAPVSHGSNATLWKGIWLGDSLVPLALKFPREPIYLNPHKVMRFQCSVQILRRLQHRNIIPLMGVKYANTNASCSIAIEFIAFPWIDNGNIVAFLGKYPNADRLKLMFDVACGLKYLHDRSIVHRAVESNSILVGKGGDAILSDFGVAKALDELDLKNPNPANPNYTVSGGAQSSLRWMAPEVSDNQYSLPADVYSWAMTTLHVFSGVLPFGTTKQPGRVVIDVSRGRRPKREDHPSPLLTDQMWGLLQRCWDQEPKDRPTIVDVLHEIAALRADLRIH
ncbi:kinase-like protein [Exidia glandulosa HHB12029]|uniref:Kinase-like protein n=1 Tax=Exidia glandulosa HHB12029 TaxID=1314781 RepID=A0A165HE55_EXIGL|nr:kinase-like protein [Exidia glandulosa HHB12029]